MILRGGFFSARQMTDDGSLRLHVRPNQQSETASADPEGCCQVDNQDQNKKIKNKKKNNSAHYSSSRITALATTFSQNHHQNVLARP